MAALDYDAARTLLDSSFAEVERAAADGKDLAPFVPDEVKAACAAVFASSTQAYRETLLGCLLARIQHRTIDIRLPYVNQGPNAFNGRTLDEQVVNPFLTDNRVPCSRGPYLGVFRRSVQFDSSTRKGLRDKTGYDAFLGILGYLESVDVDRALREVLVYLLMQFAKLRESSEIPLSRLQRLSLTQFDELV